MTARRTAIADAAIQTIAREGMRGFTHRAVDRTAGLAEGSTSYYFRTRDALLTAAMARMAELDLADVGEVPEGLDPDTMATLMCAVVTRWLTTGRERALARYELTLEATRRPTLQERLRVHGASFRALTERTLAAAGAPDPAFRAGTLVSYLDGLVLHQLTRVGAGELDAGELKAACEELVALALR